ncbi:diguanylate cyclase (GGDEF) domain-containing protein [Oceanospirillum multiglobuliferum]|uniref:diguanylate cyclase n=1 Tax=Oceanospirillum multiglobuliferum TaxID=64969 RepID=A0A1T4SGW1_9GAMM|nr:ABC transporter substrate-binding protein [Oceanospirillum multiglobuliferum]OPX54243.1 hypothetical protein BTE48_15200 [Oceanospirillum multiglobuliferum]SKA27462.1 diguanylate cyclase (GGDEF) domain-containing protein [Oceanospirillum multiglobuliferum]
MPPHWRQFSILKQMLIPLLLLLGLYPFVLSADTQTQSKLIASKSEDSAQALDKVVVQLHWLHQFEYAGFYAAQAMGFYEQEGLDVEIKALEQGVSPIQEVLSGRAQFALSNSELILERAQGHPIVLIANLFKHSPIVVLARSDSDIRRPSDLHGRKLMTNQIDLASAEIQFMFKKEQVDLTKINLSEHNYEIDGLRSGSVDAMTAYITNQPFQLSEYGIEYRIIDPANYGADFYSNSIFTTEQEVRLRPERVAGFRRATIRGWHYALQNPREIIHWAQQHYNISKSFEALMYEAREVTKLMAPDVYPIGSIDPQRMARLVEVYTQSGQLAEKIDTNAMIYPSALDRIPTQKNYSSELSFSEAEKTVLASLSEIRVCTDPNWLPYEAANSAQKSSGMTADVMAQLSIMLNKPFRRLNTDSWSESLLAAQQRKCDIFSAAHQTPERLRYMNFTQPYYQFSSVIIAPKQRAYINQVSELNGQRVVAVKGYYYAEILKQNYPDISLVLADSVIDALERVNQGQADAFIDAIATSNYYINQGRFHNLQIAGQFPHHIMLSVGTRNDIPELHSIFEKAVANLNPADLNAIYQRWISISVEAKTDYLRLWPAVLLLTLTIGTLIWMNRKLLISNQQLEAEIKSRIAAELSLKQLSEALENKNSALIELSTTDALTSLRNRYFIEAALEDAILSAQIQHQPLSIMLIDIDHFKRVNDTFGHLTGDQVLKHLGRLLAEHIPRGCYVGRWGGEEFLMVMPNTSYQMARTQAEAFRKTIAKESVPVVQSISVSIGLAQMQMDEPQASLIHRADNALYQAKAFGRNCCVVAEQGSVAPTLATLTSSGSH